MSASGRVDAAASLRSSSAMAASTTLEVSATEFRLWVSASRLFGDITLDIPNLPSSVAGGKSSTDSGRTCGLLVRSLLEEPESN